MNGHSGCVTLSWVCGGMGDQLPVCAVNVLYVRTTESEHW